jgi:hypothetical protein
MGVLERTAHTAKHNSSSDPPPLSLELNIVYGSVCNTTEMFSWAANQYHMSNNKASSSCDLNGSLIIRNPVTSLDTDCELLAQAGAVGTHTITSTPPATGTATSTSRNLITQGASGASGVSGTPQPTNSNSPSSAGQLSKSARAGIGVGIVIGCALFATCLTTLYFILRRRQRKQ